MPWRTGSKVKINVYDENGRPVCQCHNEDDAQAIVIAKNSTPDEPWRDTLRMNWLDKYGSWLGKGWPSGYFIKHLTPHRDNPKFQTAREAIDWALLERLPRGK